MNASCFWHAWSASMDGSSLSKNGWLWYKTLCKHKGFPTLLQLFGKLCVLQKLPPKIGRCPGMMCVRYSMEHSASSLPVYPGAKLPSMLMRRILPIRVTKFVCVCVCDFSYVPYWEPVIWIFFLIHFKLQNPQNNRHHILITLNVRWVMWWLLHLHTSLLLMIWLGIECLEMCLFPHSL